MLNRFAGLLPADDTVFIDNKPVKIKDNPATELRAADRLNALIKETIREEILVKDEFKQKPKTRNKRKTSVEGDTIPELTNNIIKDKPSVKLVRKAFRKMSEIAEEQRDQQMFNL